MDVGVTGTLRQRLLLYTSRVSFRRQLLLAFSIGVIVLAILSSLVTSWFGSDRTRKSLVDHGHQIAMNFGRQSTLALLYSEGDNALDAARATLLFPDVRFVAIYDLNHKQLLAQGEKPVPELEKIDLIKLRQKKSTWLKQESSKNWCFISPVYTELGSSDDMDIEMGLGSLEPELIGYVEVVLSKETLHKIIVDVFVGNLVISLFSALCLLVLLRAITLRLTQPLQQLSDIMEHTQHEGVHYRARLNGPREIQTMSLAFNKMMTVLDERDHQLREEKELLEKRVSERTSDLVAARDLALNANKAKSAFLANMSHELRTPLTAVIGYSELLEEQAELDLRKEDVEDLKKIRFAGKHLLALINDVLDLSKIESGKIDLYLETFSVTDMITEAKDIIIPLANKNNNELIIQINDQVGMMHSDKMRLHQSLYNLLSNACKFTKNGTVTLDITIEKTVDKEWALFSVADTGIGMLKKDIPKLFQDFSQADASTTRRFGGTGLGLAISKRFCQMLGGDITVQSEVDVGSTFIIRLPKTVSEEEKKEISPEKTGKDQRKEMSLVLIIHGIDEVRESFKRHLMLNGFKVETAVMAAEGIKFAKALKPNVIILTDLLLGMDGWTLLALLKEDDKTNHIPVILISHINDYIAADEFAHGEMSLLTIKQSLFRKDLKKLNISNSKGAIIFLGSKDSKTCKILISCGFSVTVAEVNNTLQELVVAEQPQLIILDETLPLMDGLKSLLALRQVNDTRNTPVLSLLPEHDSNEDYFRLNKGVTVVVHQRDRNHEELLGVLKELVVKSVRKRKDQ